MTILAIDTAIGPASVAVLQAGNMLAHRLEPEWTQQSRRLLPMIEDALAEAGLKYADLDLIAVTVGPGSFTGLRVGLTAARAIGFAADRPVHGAGTLTAIGYGQWLRAGSPPHWQADVAVAAGKGEAYVQKLRVEGAWSPPGEVRLVPLGEAALCPAPDARDLALLANDQPGLLPPTPFYLRAPDAKLPQSA